MSARASRVVARTGLAAGALTVALSVPALAVPARDSSGDPGRQRVRQRHRRHRVAAPPQAPVVASHTHAGTDVAAPDQQNPIPAPTKPIIASAPTWPENPVPLAQPQNVSASPSGGLPVGRRRHRRRRRARDRPRPPSAAP